MLINLNWGGVNWKEFNLTKWFLPFKGNQNNMAKLKEGDTPLISAKKCDNGYKCFVSDNGKRLFEGNLIKHYIFFPFILFLIILKAVALRKVAAFS